VDSERPETAPPTNANSAPLAALGQYWTGPVENSAVKVGDTVATQIEARLADDRWSCTVEGLAEGWSATLKTRVPRVYASGDTISLWVRSVDRQRQAWHLSDDNFGRFTISPNLLVRFTAAADTIIEVINCRAANDPLLAGSVSEVKGMLNRCVRQDQWDWLTVYHACGSPTYRRMHDGVAWCIELRDAVRASHDSAVRELTGLPTAADVLAMLQHFHRTVLPRPSAAVLPRPLRAGEPRTLLEGASAPAEAEPYILSLVSRVKHERANALHAETLALLADHLRQHRIDVLSNELIDAFAQLQRGPAICEIKSVTADNERSQCRSAFAQLNEYQYLHRLSTASLWVVLSARPTIPWMEDYLRSHCKLRLLWVDGNQLAGPDIAGLN
jgi:hypothetical protein